MINFFKEPEPWLLFANKHYIRKLSFDGENYELIARGFENVISVDIDMTERKVRFSIFYIMEL